MNNNCLTCGGLIPEPGKAYGYAGPICHCLVAPKIQQPMHQQGGWGGYRQQGMSESNFEYEMRNEIQTLNQKIDRILEKLK